MAGVGLGVCGSSTRTQAQIELWSRGPQGGRRTGLNSAQQHGTMQYLPYCEAPSPLSKLGMARRVRRPESQAAAVAHNRSSRICKPQSSSVHTATVPNVIRYLLSGFPASASCRASCTKHSTLAPPPVSTMLPRVRALRLVCLLPSSRCRARSHLESTNILVFYKNTNILVF